MYAVSAVKWVSGVAIQTPTVIGPIESERKSEEIADEMYLKGYDDIEIIDLLTYSEWRQDVG